MIKNKFKRLTKTGILFLFSTLLLWNCQKEENLLVEEEHSHHTQMTLQKGIVPNISNNSTLQQKLQTLRNKTSSNLNIQSKNNNDNGVLNFTINTHKASYITHGEYHSYTFPIIRFQDNGLLENLLLSYQADGTYRAYIVSYDATEEEKSTLLNDGALPDGFNKVNFKALDDINISSLFAKGTTDGICWEPQLIVPTCPYSGQHTAEQAKDENVSCRYVNGGNSIGKAYVVFNSTKCGGGVGTALPPAEGGTPSLPGTEDGGPVTPKDGTDPDPTSGDCNDTLNIGFDDGNGGCIKDTTFPTADEVDEAIKDIMGCVSLSREDIGFLQTFPNLTVNIKNLLNNNVCSDEAQTEAKMRILAEKVNDLNHKTRQWDFSRSGVFPNRPALKYKAVHNPNIGETMYLLENGMVLYQSSTRRKINKNNIPDTIGSTEQETDGFNYIYSYDSKKWFEYRLPKPDYPKADINFIFDAFWDRAKIVGRYATPIEDIIILVDGKDFDGVEQSKVQTAGFMIVGFIPGGKAVKPISKGLGKVWKVVIKNGDKVFTRTVRELTKETIQHFDRYAEGAKDLLQEALRKGDILDDEIIIEVGQEIADLSKKKGRKLTWPEVKALFKRGNDFNDKASDIYEFNEIVLETGKRLDSYIPGLEIISRKATTLSNIKPETFKSYLKELITKYPKESVLNSSQLPKGTKLAGDYFLEIPLSNKSFFESSSSFQTVLTQFNVDNNVLVRIKYLAE